MSAAKEAARELPGPVCREQARKVRPAAWHPPRRAGQRDGRQSLGYHGGRGWAAGPRRPRHREGAPEVNGWQLTSPAGVVR